MKKIIIAVVIFIALPTLLGQLGQSDDETQLISGMVIYLEMLFLFLLILIRKNQIIEKLKNINPEYHSDRVTVCGTILESHVERIKHRKFTDMDGDREWHRDETHHNELVLNIAYEWEKERRETTVRERIGFVPRDSHIYDAGQEIQIYINPNQYEDVLLYNQGDYNDSYRILRIWISILSVAGIVWAVYCILNTAFS